MTLTERADKITLRAKNIGGITETEVTFSPGVTILEGENATNRTSLLQVIMAACGSDRVSVKGDADEGCVEMDLGEETYTRTLESSDNGLMSRGTPYLDNSMVADLFAFLLESNPARRAVERGDDLRDIIMRPVDTAEIEAAIDQNIEWRQEIDEELAEIEDLKRTLPGLERRRKDISEQIEEIQERLAEKKAEVEAASDSLEQSLEQQPKLEEYMADLNEKRATLDDIRFDIETKKETMNALREEKRSLESERADLPKPDTVDTNEIEDHMGTLRERKRALTGDINDLQSAVQFNERVLSDQNDGLLESPEESGIVTDRLVNDGTVTCWTCGTSVERAQIESTIETLREQIREHQTSIDELDEELEELTERRESLKGARRDRERIEHRLPEITEQIESVKSDIEMLQTRREETISEIESTEADIGTMEADTSEGAVELHNEANELEYELGGLERDYEEVEHEIAEIENRIEQQSELESEREQIQETITEQRTKVKRLEQETIEVFNEHAAELLTVLEYDNLDRIWIERTAADDGTTPIPDATFSLHVIRSTDSGVTYEDKVEHLSESEREITGLLFGFAGYLAHDVHERVPFLLLDSLEAIDADRISALIKHFEQYSEYLIVPLLPEDAQASESAYDRITDV